jgi:hypothetical protein
MNRLNRSILLATLMSVSGVQYVSGFAQMDTDEHDERLASHSAVRAYVAAESAEFDRVARAPNIVISPVYEPVVELMLARSATFRRQYARVAGTPRLSVIIRSQPVTGSLLPGLTNIRRGEHGRVEAVVTIVACGRAAELIAHEIEHIIEQLDGVDLRLKSRLRASGVHRTHDMAEVFETMRAVAIGRRVADELRNAP